LMRRRASSRSRCSWASGPSARPHLTAAALIRWIAAVGNTSTGRTCAMSRVACAVGSGLGDSLLTLVAFQIDRPCPELGGPSTRAGVQVEEQLLTTAAHTLYRGSS